MNFNTCDLLDNFAKGITGAEISTGDEVLDETLTTTANAMASFCEGVGINIEDASRFIQQMSNQLSVDNELTLRNLYPMIANIFPDQEDKVKDFVVRIQMSIQAISLFI